MISNSQANNLLIFDCTLDIENNKCKFLSDDKKHCTATDTQCSFRKSQNIVNNNAYVKPEKWFEKYYKNKGVK